MVAARTLDENAGPVLLFRFQNAGIPKHSAFTLSIPDGQASCAPSAQARLWGKSPLSLQQNAKGFQHSSTVSIKQAPHFHPAVFDSLYS